MILPQQPVPHAVISSSSAAAAALTWVDEMAVPQSCSTMSETLRIETPLTYISAIASLSARSLCIPFRFSSPHSREP
ncbi:MAG: hypothetical protein ABFC92_07920 [Rectinema sp.]